MEPYADDLALAFALADAASAVTMRGFGGRQRVELKADTTPVTELDAAAERAIRTMLEVHRPDDGVVGEEGGVTVGRGDRVWVLDPIDGTRMFAEGIPLWSTLIALRVGSEVVVSVADAPAVGERFHAVRGGGAWWDDRRVHVSDVDSLADSLVLHAALEEFARGTGVDALLQVVSSARATRGIADAWAHLLVARGAAEALVEQGPCFEWDWAATGLVVEEAGGRLTRLEGGPAQPGCHLLVSNGRVDDEIRQRLGLASPAVLG
ncbi:MAG: inositol monophosphatase family protein [Actinomycetes bacterium]